MKRVWTDRYGKKIKIKEMTTNHIENCLRFLRNRQEKTFAVALNSVPKFNPEGMASYYSEMEIDGFLKNESDLEFNEYVIAFRKELQRRRNVCNDK
jgi:hypothetical protein